MVVDDVSGLSGGAAVLAAAHRIPEARAVCTIAAWANRYIGAPG